MKNTGWDEVGGSGGPLAPRKSLHLLLAPPAQGPWRDWKKPCGPWLLPSPHPRTLWGRVGSPQLSIWVLRPFPSLFPAPSSFCLHLSALISLHSSPSSASLLSLTLIFICGIFGYHGKPKKEVSVPFKTSAFFPPPSLLLSPSLSSSPLPPSPFSPSPPSRRRRGLG